MAGGSSSWERLFEIALPAIEHVFGQANPARPPDWSRGGVTALMLQIGHRLTDASARFKQQAGEQAASLVQAGMVVGLGTGSTATFAIRRVAARLHAGDLSDILAVATSVATKAAAAALGIPMLTDDAPREIDPTIDGADEVNPALDLIKGGGALLREKIVAQASRREVIVVDAGKLSPLLGTHWPLPVKVLEFGWRSQACFLEGLGAAVTPRTHDGGLYRTDLGNIILDSRFGPIADPAHLAGTLQARAGPVGHGLFLGIASWQGKMGCAISGAAWKRQWATRLAHRALSWRVVQDFGPGRRARDAFWTKRAAHDHRDYSQGRARWLWLSPAATCVRRGKDTVR